MSATADEGADASGLRHALRARLAALGGPLQVLAEGILGEGDGRIDWIAAEPTGRIWVVLVAGAGGDDRLLVRGLAQRAWVRARLPDWRQLARDLPASQDIPPLLVLLAPEFSRLVRVAAREADGDGIRLGRYRWQPGPRGAADLRVERLAPLETSLRGDAPPAEPVPKGPLSVFKSGLTDRDFEARAGRPPLGSPEGSDNSRPADDNS